MALSSAEQIRSLQEAAHDNDIQAAEQLLQLPQDPDLEAGGFPPALHHACVQGHTKAARLLLEANADKDRAFVKDDTTPMHWAYSSCQREALRLLLEANADKEKAYNGGATPLFMASQEGHLDVVRLLPEANADKEKAHNSGATPRSWSHRTATRMWFSCCWRHVLPRIRLVTMAQLRC